MYPHSHTGMTVLNTIFLYLRYAMPGFGICFHAASQQGSNHNAATLHRVNSVKHGHMIAKSQLNATGNKECRFDQEPAENKNKAKQQQDRMMSPVKAFTSSA